VKLYTEHAGQKGTSALTSAPRNVY